MRALGDHRYSLQLGTRQRFTGPARVVRFESGESTGPRLVACHMPGASTIPSKPATNLLFGSSLCSEEWLLDLPEGSCAKRCPGSGPLFLQPCTRPSRGTPRRLPVAPLIPDQRGDGESPVGLRRYERAVGGRHSSHSIENIEEPAFAFFASALHRGARGHRSVALVARTRYAQVELKPCLRLALRSPER